MKHTMIRRSALCCLASVAMLARPWARKLKRSKTEL